LISVALLSGLTLFLWYRVAARLRKLAAQLESKYEGKVSTMKDMHDAHELNRQIINLHGLSTNTGSIFLRLVT
jgi:hypothetical protein